MLVPTIPAVNVGDDPLVISLLGGLVLLACATVGALVAVLHPSNPIGWLLAGSTLLSAFGNLAIVCAVYALVTRPGSLPAGAWLGTFGASARTLGFLPSLIVLLLTAAFACIRSCQ